MISPKPLSAPTAAATDAAKPAESTTAPTISDVDSKAQGPAASTTQTQAVAPSETQKAERRTDNFGSAAAASGVAVGPQGPVEDFRRLQQVARGASQAVSKGVGLDSMKERSAAALQLMGLYGIGLRLSDYEAGKVAIDAWLEGVKGLDAAQKATVRKGALKGVRSLVNGPGFVRMDNEALAALKNNKFTQFFKNIFVKGPTDKVPFALQEFHVALPDKIVGPASEKWMAKFPAMTTTPGKLVPMTGSQITSKGAEVGLKGCMNWLDEVGDAAQMAERVAKWIKTLPLPQFFGDAVFKKGVRAASVITNDAGVFVNKLTGVPVEVIRKPGIWNKYVNVIASVLGGLGKTGVEGIRLILKLVPVIAWAGVAIDAVRLRDAYEDPTSSEAKKAWAASAVVTGALGIMAATFLVTPVITLPLAAFSVLAGYMRETSKEAGPA